MSFFFAGPRKLSGRTATHVPTLHYCLKLTSTGVPNILENFASPYKFNTYNSKATGNSAEPFCTVRMPNSMSCLMQFSGNTPHTTEFLGSKRALEWAVSTEAAFKWQVSTKTASNLYIYESTSREWGTTVRRQERKLFQQLHKISLRFIPLLCLYIQVHFIVGSSGKLAWRLCMIQKSK